MPKNTTHLSSPSSADRMPPAKHEKQPMLSEIFGKIRKQAVEAAQLQKEGMVEARINSPQCRGTTRGERPEAPEGSPYRK